MSALEALFLIDELAHDWLKQLDFLGLAFEDTPRTAIGRKRPHHVLQAPGKRTSRPFRLLRRLLSTFRVC